MKTCLFVSGEIFLTDFSIEAASDVCIYSRHKDPVYKRFLKEQKQRDTPRNFDKYLDLCAKGLL